MSLRLKLAATLAVPLLLAGAALAPAAASAASLSSEQISAILGLLRAFGADASVVSSVSAALGGTAGTGTAVTCLNLTRTLSTGDTGSDVSSLQNYLADKGYFLYSGGSTGYYGGVTADAVRQLQSGLRLTVTGTINEDTRSAIACDTPPEGESIASLSVSPEGAAAGDTVTVTWGSIEHPASSDRIALFKSGDAYTGTNLSNNGRSTWVYPGSCSQTLPASGKASGSCDITLPSTLGSGTFYFVLLKAGTYSSLARSGSLSITGGTGVPPPPTLTVNHSTIAKGDSATLAWGSASADTCTGTNFTPGTTSGSVTVMPTQTTTYSIFCTNKNGDSATRSVTITVNAQAVDDAGSVILTLCPPAGGACASNGETLRAAYNDFIRVSWETSGVSDCSLTDLDGTVSSVGADNPTPGWGRYVGGTTQVKLSCKDSAGMAHVAAVSVSLLTDSAVHLTVCSPRGSTNCAGNGGSLTVASSTQVGVFWSTTNIPSTATACTYNIAPYGAVQSVLQVGNFNGSPGWGVYMGNLKTSVMLTCRDNFNVPRQAVVTLNPAN